MIPDRNDDSSNKDLIEALRARAERALAGRSFSGMLEDTRAIIGGSMPPTELGKLAEKALMALQNMSFPTPKQMSALETVIRLMRPVPLSNRGRLEDIDQKILPDFSYWPDFQEKVKPYLYSIGRIDLLPREGVGTGFLISEKLIVTNRHVLDQLSHGSMILEKGQAAINFGYEYGVTESGRTAAIVAVRAVHPTLDIALLEIDTQVFDGQRRPLDILANGETEKGEQIAAVGYPFKDSRNPLFVEALFGGVFGVKRAAIGEVLQTTANSIFHDCSTLGGNSGSPLFSMKSAKVIGLHRDGYFLYRNEAVDSQSLKSFIQENV